MSKGVWVKHDSAFEGSFYNYQIKGQTMGQVWQGAGGWFWEQFVGGLVDTRFGVKPTFQEAKVEVEEVN